MSEGAMSPMVLAIAPPKALRQLAKSSDDVKDFTKRIEVARDRAPGWPAGGEGQPRELGVHAESAGLFYDIFGDARVLAALTREPEVLKHLRWAAACNSLRASPDACGACATPSTAQRAVILRPRLLKRLRRGNAFKRSPA
jgi:hypothetical protein